MLGKFAKAVIYRPSEEITSTPSLPQQIESLRHEILPAHCENYHRLVSWSLAERACIHPSYIQVLTMPMQLNMMSKFPFPFRALGLVHVANKINVVKLPCKHSILDLNTYFGDHYSHNKGVVFELHSEASQNGVVAVKATSFYLAKIDRRPASSLHPFNDALLLGDAYANEKSLAMNEMATVGFEESIGRQYAKVSGDYNPIHLWPVTSRLFGFKHAIAHGMYSHALSLSLLQREQHCDLRQNRSIKALFKQPIILPSQTTLNMADSTPNKTLFSLTPFSQTNTASQLRPHMLGLIDSI